MKVFSKDPVKALSAELTDVLDFPRACIVRGLLLSLMDCKRGARGSRRPECRVQTERTNGQDSNQTNRYHGAGPQWRALNARYHRGCVAYCPATAGCCLQRKLPAVKTWITLRVGKLI